MKDAVFIWSGGKDSALALYRVLQHQTYCIRFLVTTFSIPHNRVSMHGVAKRLIEEQADSLGIPLWPVFIPEDTTLGTYETEMHHTFLQLKSAGITTAIFGDIYLEDLKLYREQQLALANLDVYFPLWGESTTDLVQEFINQKFKALLVCVSDSRLGSSFIGRQINQVFLRDLPIPADPAGEQGEYHSFVYAGPIFKRAISFKMGEVTFQDYAVNSSAEANALNYDTKFWFLDLLPATTY